MNGFCWADRYLSSDQFSKEVLDGLGLDPSRLELASVAEERKERCWFLAFKIAGRCPLQFCQDLKEFSVGRL